MQKVFCVSTLNLECSYMSINKNAIVARLFFKQRCVPRQALRCHSERFMFTFNHEKITRSYEVLFGVPKSAAALGQEAILGFLEQDPDVADVRWAAYMLATVKHECAD
jgi:hypothetical protein